MVFHQRSIMLKMTSYISPHFRKIQSYTNRAVYVHTINIQTIALFWKYLVQKTLCAKQKVNFCLQINCFLHWLAENSVPSYLMQGLFIFRQLLPFSNKFNRSYLNSSRYKKCIWKIKENLKQYRALYAKK